MQFYFCGDRDLGRCDLGVFIVARDFATLLDGGVAALAGRVIEKRIQRILNRVEARCAGFDIAFVGVGLANFELEATAGPIEIEALYRLNLRSRIGFLACHYACPWLVERGDAANPHSTATSKRDVRWADTRSVRGVDESGLCLGKHESPTVVRPAVAVAHESTCAALARTASVIISARTAESIGWPLSHPAPHHVAQSQFQVVQKVQKFPTGRLSFSGSNITPPSLENLYPTSVHFDTLRIAMPLCASAWSRDRVDRDAEVMSSRGGFRGWVTLLDRSGVLSGGRRLSYPLNLSVKHENKAPAELSGSQRIGARIDALAELYPGGSFWSSANCRVRRIASCLS